MKATISTLFIWILASVFNAAGQTFDMQMRLADSIWRSNDLLKASALYGKLVRDTTVPEEYRSLVLLRTAESQFRSGSKNEAAKSLSAIRSLSMVPGHHTLQAEEISRRMRGLPVSLHTRPEKISIPIATLVVTEVIHPTSPKNTTFRTIDEALQAAGSILKEEELPEGVIEIVIQGDTYLPARTINIGLDLSGNEKNRLVIRGESPVKKITITGGVNLRKWRTVRDQAILKRLPPEARGKVLFTRLSSNGISGIDSLIFGGFSSRRASIRTRSHSLLVPELFYKGVPQIMARWPNDRDTIIPLEKFRDKRVLKWAEEKDLWLHGYWKYMWADAYEKVGSVSVEDTLINLEPPLNNYGFGVNKWHAVNALSEIDMPGEWCFTVGDETIWYYPPENFKEEECILSVFGPVFDVLNCNFLTIKDLDFRYIRGDAIVITKSDNVSLINCSISNGSGYGMKIMEGKNYLIHSCRIENMGRGGIDIISGRMRELESSGSIIENCTISKLSRIDRTYTPAILLEGVGIKVRHCLFSDIPSSGIRLEGNDHLVELNEFTRCVIESDDQGAIDVFGNPLYRGNVIRWNYFHDIGVPDLHMAAGVRLDDAISGFSLYDNLFARSSGNMFGAIQIHGGKDNYLEGNIMADCHAGISQSAWGDKRWETTLATDGNPISTAVNTWNWMTEKWQRRYPTLKKLRQEGTDRNFAVNNILINGQNMFLRKSPKFQTLNNKMLSTPDKFIKPGDFRKFAEPWQNIPFDDIGPYRE